MLKNKVFLILTAAFFLSFYTNNKAFSIENAPLTNRYPDFSYEFTGKDKCEKFNRKLFIFNLKLNKYVVRPVNIVWASIMPKYGMDRLQNAYNNMNFPVRFVSCLLQKDFKSSRQEALRFLTNTTIGLGGLYDPAKDKFKIEPRQEDMGQVLANYNIKLGPYLVLPVVRGNIRDLVGQLLDYPLRPLSYVPIAGGVANALFSLNNLTYIQPVIKRIDTVYADPYEIAKQIHGLERYIKNTNLDREEVFKEKTVSQNIIKISNVKHSEVKPDIELKNYNPQSPLIDSMRTALFERHNQYKSKWTELSVWNRNFDKKIKTGAVLTEYKHPKYKYRYILQKDKTSPLAIIYPSIGEGITSDHSTVLARLLYEEGFSVIIQGSAFQWEFVNSMPEYYRPGLPYQDANYLREVSSKIIRNIEDKKNYKFGKKILIGNSFGGLTTLFAAAQEENKNILGISKYISISPPVELFYALRQLDKNSEDWKNDSLDIKMRTAITAQKVLKTAKNISDKKTLEESEYLPFTDDEAKLIIGFIMKQKLSDVVFAVENCSRAKKNDLTEVNRMSFYNYGEKYLSINNENLEKTEYDSSLYSLNDFLQKSDNYKIYHSLDDYFVNPEQLVKLKKQTGNKTVLLSNGSHLGFLYRQEFIDELKKDIRLEPAEQSTEEVDELTEKLGL
ncbi:MAG: MlaA family lipoprotein [Candidatus Gastranaerophilales bacterium]|nr:MlaA family lipoprotein [Candidatus Gastranaerophilales bacterium]